MTGSTKKTAVEDIALADVLGTRSAQAIKKNLGCGTVGEFLDYMPSKHIFRGQLTPISSLVESEQATIYGEVLSVKSRYMRQRKGMIVDVSVVDSEDDIIKLSFFNGYRAKNELKPAVQTLFSGKVSQYRGEITLTNPDFMVLDEQSSDVDSEVNRPIPIYPAKANLSSWSISHMMNQVLDTIDLSQLREPVDRDIRSKEKLVSRANAYLLMHRPEDRSRLQKAFDYFKFEEAYVLQTILAQEKREYENQRAIARGYDQEVLDEFDSNLEFRLTKEQKRVGQSLAKKIEASTPMNVLLQGDVGSGKTLVALRAMLQCVAEGGQAALLAPTEVLATQHYFSILEMLKDLGQPTHMDLASDFGLVDEQDSKGYNRKKINVSLLTGSQNTAQRRTNLLDIASGKAQIIIGTHALLSKGVSFYDLGLVVVDEQHRFGVEQREGLRHIENTKYNSHEELKQNIAPIPHTLVMSATPIPRTMAMTIFGTVDVETLAEVPAGRKEIKTYVVNLSSPDEERNEKWQARIWQRAVEEIKQGRQVYVVCPSIYSSQHKEKNSEDGLDKKEKESVEKTYDLLTHTPVFKTENSYHHPIKIAMLHGAMSAQDKAEVMAAFEEGKIDVLVSTTIIEVGVNVPNASMMIILDAGQFGISQLHQIRGRVGRGSEEGLCLLVSHSDEHSVTMDRLRAVAKTRDGFELSIEDIKARKEGNILGSEQSGRGSKLKYVRIIEDAPILENARKYAIGTVQNDRGLRKHSDLRKAISSSFDEKDRTFIKQS